MWDRVQDDKSFSLAFELLANELKRLKLETIPNLLSVKIIASGKTEYTFQHYNHCYSIDMPSELVNPTCLQATVASSM